MTTKHFRHNWSRHYSAASVLSSKPPRAAAVICAVALWALLGLELVTKVIMPLSFVCAFLMVWPVIELTRGASCRGKPIHLVGLNMPKSLVEPVTVTLQKDDP